MRLNVGSGIFSICGLICRLDLLFRLGGKGVVIADQSGERFEGEPRFPHVVRRGGDFRRHVDGVDGLQPVAGIFEAAERF